MRDVGVYDRALTPEEVLNNYLNTDFTTNATVPDKLYYKMLEGNTSNSVPQSIADSSADGVTPGTIGGGVSTLWTNNIIGTADTAIHFDGGTTNPGPPTGTYITTTNTTLFDFTTNSFSMNFWILPYTGSGFIAGNNTFQSCGWSLTVDSDHVLFSVETSGSESSVATANPISGWPNTDSAYYSMVTVVRDGTNTPVIYIDGLPRAINVYTSYATFPIPSPSTNPLTFGIGTNGDGLLQLDGNIWLSQIWGSVLGGPSILTLCSNQLAGTPFP